MDKEPLISHYNVIGLNCTSCVMNVEKAVSALKGVNKCSVSLLTESMIVEGNLPDEIIVDAVSKAGYKVIPIREDNIRANEAPLKVRKKDFKMRLIFSLIFLLILIYFSMGHEMLNLPIPSILAANDKYPGIAQMFLTLIILVINREFFTCGLKGAVHLSFNMDTLVALGSFVSFIWSVYALFTGGTLYFESSSMIPVIILIGRMIENKSKVRTKTALDGLINLTPTNATLIKGEREIPVPVQEVSTGDIFIVKVGESIPVDGVVIDGISTVDESTFTGESISVEKKVGSKVWASTINESGSIKCRAEHIGADTMLSKIIKLVTDAAATKAPIARIADKVAGVFVPAVMIISALTFTVRLLLGYPLDNCLSHAIAVLLISCPCALGLATPVAIMVGNGVGARYGVLYKNAVALEYTGKASIAVLDKTGTVTEGKPSVIRIIPCHGISKEQLIKSAYLLETESEHPLSKAIKSKAEELNIECEKAKEYIFVPGNGVCAVISDNDRLYGGSIKYVSQYASFDDDMLNEANKLAQNGSTIVAFANNHTLLGIIAIADSLRKDSIDAIRMLKDIGMEVVMLTGDNKHTAAYIARKAGIDKVIAGVLPNMKASIINSLKRCGTVLMVGDGVNDAPSLTCADVGIAIGSGTDIAIDSSDVVVMNERLRDVVRAIRLSKATIINVKENLFWAFIYNTLCIPLAAGCYEKILGWSLSPIVAAIAMSLSSICVVSNALRLNFFNPDSPKYDKVVSGKLNAKEFSELIDNINENLESKQMTKKIIIEGMMCQHCQAHTKKALEALPGVISANASYVDKEAIVELSEDVSDEVLIKAVTEAGYTVIEIK